MVYSSVVDYSTVWFCTGLPVLMTFLAKKLFMKTTRISLIALSSLLFMAACSNDKAGKDDAGAGQSSMPPAAVTVAMPVVGDMSENMNVVGSLAAYESAVISAEIAGTIKKIHIRDGQKVRKGQTLFSIESESLQAELKNAIATVELRKLEKSRMASLLEQRVTSQYEFDKANTQLLTAEAARDYAQAQLNKAEIKAPFDGHLGIRKANEGAYVKQGAALIELVQLHPLLLDFSVPETALNLIRVNDTLNVSFPAMPEIVGTAKIVAIEPAMNTTTRSVMVRASIDNKNDQLRPGIFARIDLPVKNAKTVLWLPEGALFYQGDKKYVLVNNKGTALRKAVEVGSFQNGQVAILSGLNATDEVVVGGHHKAPFDGMPLMVTNKPKPATEAEPASTPSADKQ